MQNALRDSEARASELDEQLKRKRVPKNRLEEQLDVLTHKLAAVEAERARWQQQASHLEEIAEAELVAGPGCNSTAALLALLPLAGRIEEAAVDIKAGVSGAGREATEETHFVSVVDNVNAYKVEGHRHTAELEQELPGVHFSFVAHLLPIDQGILASCYARPTAPVTAAEAHELAVETYRDEPFVEVVSHPPRTRDVRDTNRATVQVTVVNERVLAFCAIDNLWKGAAGQAVQDLNLMLGLPETEGLR